MYQNTRTFLLSPMKFAGWQMWFDQNGTFVVSCRKTVWKFPHRNIPKFSPKFWVEIRGKFLNLSIPRRIDIKISLRWDLCMSFYQTLTFLGIYEENFLVKISSLILSGKYGEIPTCKILFYFSWISAGKLWWTFHGDNPLKFSHKSMWKSGGRGWLSRWEDLPSAKLNVVCWVKW